MRPLMTLRWLLALGAAFVVALSAGTSCLVANVAGDDMSAASTFRTESLVVDTTSALGDVNYPTSVGPTRQTLTIPGGAYPYGEVNLTTLTGTVPPWPLDLFATVIRSSAGADCTTHAQHSGAMALEVTGSRTAGANDLVNTALELTARNAQQNIAMHVLAGDTVLEGSGQLYQGAGGSAFFAGAYLSTGASTPLIVQGNGARAIYISADPGPTDSIYSNAADPKWNAHNAFPSELTLYNDSSSFTLNLHASTAGYEVRLRPDPIVTITNGAFGAGSTTLAGHVTGVGATSTVITYANAFATESRCYAQVRGTVPQFITVDTTAASATFRCFAAATGAAANCENFSYWCEGR